MLLGAPGAQLLAQPFPPKVAGDQEIASFPLSTQVDRLDRPCCYLVQFAVDPFNLAGHMCRRGYSVVGLQVNTCYSFCETELQSMTIVKYIFNPLEKHLAKRLPGFTCSSF